MTDEQPEHHVRAVLIPADPDEPVVVQMMDVSETGRWNAVGGAQPEVLPLDGDGTTLFCDGYGKVKRLPRNDRATRLVDGLRAGFASTDYVAGPALVTGWDPDGSGPADVPDAVAIAAQAS